MGRQPRRHLLHVSLRYHFSLLAQEPDDGDPVTGPVIGPVVDPAATQYAKQFSVSYAEAERRLGLQGEMVQFADKVLSVEPNFAGAWIEHEPVFRLVIALAQSDADKVMQPYLDGLDWANAVNIVVAHRTLKQLQDGLLALRARIERTEIAVQLVYGYGLYVPDAKIRLYTPDVEGLNKLLDNEDLLTNAGLSKSDNDVLEQKEHVVPAQWKYPYLNGSTPLSSCTMGFVVRRLADDRRFVSTAGHCDNAQYVDFAGPLADDTYLGPIVVENNPYTTPPTGPLGNTVDIQIHNSWVRDFDLTNLVQTDVSALQRVSYSQTMANTTGLYVCKYGRATGYSCGRVNEINSTPPTNPPPANTFVRVVNLLWSGEIACPGDSGAAVYSPIAGGVVAAVGVLSVAQDNNCNSSSYVFWYAPIDQFMWLGYDALSYERPQYYYQNVYWSDTNCVEYSSRLDAYGNITTQQSQACRTTPPGSGTVHSYTGYAVADTLREGMWRGNTGYVRTVPLTAEGRVNWSAAPAWSVVGPGTPPRAQDEYIIGNYYYQNVFWSESSCIEYRFPLDDNSNRIASQGTQRTCRTTAPGTGTIQSYTAWVVNDQLREAMWRNNIGYMRSVPLNAAKTDAQWSSAPNWTQCCTGAAPQAQGVFILNHP